MQLKVKHVLAHFPVERLRDLCRARDLSPSGVKQELQERLARSYRGAALPLAEALTRSEMIRALEEVRFEVQDRQARWSYLGQTRSDDLKTLVVRVFGDAWEPRVVGEQFALGGCPAKLNWDEPENLDDDRESLLSTQHQSAGFSPLTIHGLRRELEGARSLSIASAYYDKVFFLSLLEPPLEQLREVRVVVNGLAGPRLEDQVRELSALQQRLAGKYEQVEIRLAFAKTIFHPKLYLIRKHGAMVALIGSANATTAATEDNEGILLRLREGTSSLESYFEHIWLKHSESLETQQGHIRTLVNFFRTGRLFFKAASSFQMSVNPFSEFLRLLPRDERQKLSNVRLRNSEPQPGVGPFELLGSIGLSPEEETQSTKADEETHRASIKPDSVETCFGFWVPGTLVEELTKKLDGAGAGKKERLLRIARALAHTPEDAVLRAYGEYLEDARRVLSALPSFSVVKSQLVVDPFDSEKRLVERLRGWRSRLAQESYVDRLSRPFSDTVMPEIWDDRVASRDFEDSFFDYLAYVSDLPTKSRVPRRILERAGCKGSAERDAVRDGLREYLKEPGWHHEEDWASL